MTQSEIKKLASEMVGDGGTPNKFFVTSSPYIKVYDEEDYGYIDELIENCDVNAIETFGPFDTYEEAKEAYLDIELDVDAGIGSVIIEDRECGTVCERFLKKIVRVDYVEDEYEDHHNHFYNK